jgi:hypothetical protein
LWVCHLTHPLKSRRANRAQCSTPLYILKQKRNFAYLLKCVAPIACHALRFDCETQLFDSVEPCCTADSGIGGTLLHTAQKSQRIGATIERDRKTKTTEPNNRARPSRLGKRWRSD